MNPKESILFVYNADGTYLAKAKDFVHRIVSSSTYQCNLCKITYGNVSMNSRWKRFIEELPMSIRFLHKDEFEQCYPEYSTDYPVALRESNHQLNIFISTDELNGFGNLDELIDATGNKLR